MKNTERWKLFQRKLNLNFKLQNRPPSRGGAVWPLDAASRNARPVRESHRSQRRNYSTIPSKRFPNDFHHFDVWKRSGIFCFYYWNCTKITITNSEIIKIKCSNFKNAIFKWLIINFLCTIFVTSFGKNIVQK